jgi:hypothetical protein
VLARLYPSDVPYDDWFVAIVDRAVSALAFIAETFAAADASAAAAT